jgi:hypothetical protein
MNDRQRAGKPVQVLEPGQNFALACGASSVAPRVAFSEYDENSILIGLPLEGSLRVASHGSLLRLTSRTIRRSLRSYLRSDCSGPGSFVGSDGIFFPRRISVSFSSGVAVRVFSESFHAEYAAAPHRGPHFTFHLGFAVVALRLSPPELLSEFLVTETSFSAQPCLASFTMVVYGALYLRDIPRLLPLTTGSYQPGENNGHSSSTDDENDHFSVLAPPITARLVRISPEVFEI